ncbi:MAG: tetracycline regulation of excision, RteC [Daejeonella sp.]|nr:tetracycline regulation of excision, RteC [Daejeonella sp.]
MEEFVHVLKASLDYDLQKIHASDDHILKVCQSAIVSCKRALTELKHELLKQHFKDVSEEIWFFKTAKPYFVSKLIYYDNLYKIEIRRPMGRDKVVRKFFESEMIHLEYAYENINSFHIYYRTGQTANDKQYFTRNADNLDRNYETLIFDSDCSLSTGYDNKIATILAHDQLLLYLNNEVNKLKRQSEIVFESPNTYNLQWTGSKTGLVELIYALAQAGAFNHGKAEYKEIAYYFEKVFNVPLGNIYKTFEKIRMRECGPTTFLDNCKSKLVEYVDKFNQLRIN